MVCMDAATGALVGVLVLVLLLREVFGQHTISRLVRQHETDAERAAAALERSEQRNGNLTGVLCQFKAPAHVQVQQPEFTPEQLDALEEAQALQANGWGGRPGYGEPQFPTSPLGEEDES